jgi:hydroxymethylpyrimidine/phosphomethylpyrimidine kinase
VTAIALTIAGSDSGGGAGIQADLKTFSALGVFGTSVVTAITAQNTTGVRAVEDVSPAGIAAQMDAVYEDMAVGATKIGMVSRSETIGVLAERLRHHGVRPVLDPVMVATSGDRLLQPDAIGALRRELLPLAVLVTPNLPEAALLTDTPQAADEAAMIAQAEMIVKAGAGAALVKGGHAGGAESTDILFDGEGVLRLTAPRIETANTHGTGCTLSAAIAAGLARGMGLVDAVGEAKEYLSRALEAGAAMRIGRGRGPVHHFHRWWPG